MKRPQVEETEEEGDWDEWLEETIPGVTEYLNLALKEADPRNAFIAKKLGIELGDLAELKKKLSAVLSLKDSLGEIDAQFQGKGDKVVDTIVGFHRNSE